MPVNALDEIFGKQIRLKALKQGESREIKRECVKGELLFQREGINMCRNDLDAWRE